MSEYEPGQDPFTLGGSTAEKTKDDAHKGGGGGGVSKPGMYHVTVESVEFKPEDEKPNVKIIMNVLSGTEESEFGKRIYHYIYFNKLETEESEQKRFFALVVFLNAFGVIPDEEAFGRENVIITKTMLERLEGCQAIVKVVYEKPSEYVDKKTQEKKMRKESWKIAWNNDVWNIHHEHVKDVPKDWEMANMIPAPRTASELAADLNDI
jgi:hypothetical protein